MPLTGIRYQQDWMETASTDAGYDNYCFRSSHASGKSAVFADGSVQIIGYTVAPNIFNRLADRRDGSTIGSAAY
jgi:hypothetical protein